MLGSKYFDSNFHFPTPLSSRYFHKIVKSFTHHLETRTRVSAGSETPCGAFWGGKGVSSSSGTRDNIVQRI